MQPRSFIYRNAVKRENVEAGLLDASALERNCHKCREVLKSHEELINHMEHVHGETHLCVKCGQTFLFSQQVSQHAKNKCEFPMGPRNLAMPWSCRYVCFVAQSASKYYIYKTRLKDNCVAL